MDNETSKEKARRKIEEDLKKFKGKIKKIPFGKSGLKL